MCLRVMASISYHRLHTSDTASRSRGSCTYGSPRSHAARAHSPCTQPTHDRLLSPPHTRFLPSNIDLRRLRTITIVEMFHCTKSDAYSWVHTVTEREDVSCCTVIAESFVMTTPEILAGQGFSRLLLAGILMDTGNLSSPNCTSKDKYMATLLINGAGRFAFNGLYQILKYTTNSSYDLKVEDILQKEFKKWTVSGKPNTTSSRLGPNIGMSSIGMSIAQLLSHDSVSTQEIIHFQKLEKLGILMVVSGYYDSQKRFKREILVSAESSLLMKNMLMFLNSSADQLPLRALNQSGLQGEMRVFEIDKVASRRTIERLLNDFTST